MKSSDYISIFSIAIAGTILGYFLVNYFLGNPADKVVSFEYVEPIATDLVTPSSEVFNSRAINPTVEVYVGSCADLNGDGQIDSGELQECGERKAFQSGVSESETQTQDNVTTEADTQDATVVDGSSNTENVNSGTESQDAQAQAEAEADRRARQETVSQ